VDIVLYDRMTRMAIAAWFFAILTPTYAQIGAAYSNLLATTVASSARLACEGPPMLGMSLPIAFADSVAFAEAEAMCLVKLRRLSSSTTMYRICRLTGIG